MKRPAKGGHGPLKPDDPANNGVGNEDDDDDDEGRESDATAGNDQQPTNNDKEMWPAWVYCTRYSDRPSSGKSETRKRFTSHIPVPPPNK